MDNKLGDFIREKRGNLSLREFANKCGISHTHLDSLEKGYAPHTGKKINVTIDVLNKLSNALNVDVQYLSLLSLNQTPEDADFKLDDSNLFNQDKTVISIGRGGERKVYEISDEDAALVNAFIEKMAKKS